MLSVNSKTIRTPASALEVVEKVVRVSAVDSGPEPPPLPGAELAHAVLGILERADVAEPMVVAVCNAIGRRTVKSSINLLQVLMGVLGPVDVSVAVAGHTAVLVLGSHGKVRESEYIGPARGPASTLAAWARVHAVNPDYAPLVPQLALSSVYVPGAELETLLLYMARQTVAAEAARADGGTGGDVAPDPRAYFAFHGERSAAELPHLLVTPYRDDACRVHVFYGLHALLADASVQRRMAAYGRRLVSSTFVHHVSTETTSMLTLLRALTADLNAVVARVNTEASADASGGGSKRPKTLMSVAAEHMDAAREAAIDLAVCTLLVARDMPRLRDAVRTVHANITRAPAEDAGAGGGRTGAGDGKARATRASTVIAQFRAMFDGIDAALSVFTAY